MEIAPLVSAGGDDRYLSGLPRLQLLTLVLLVIWLYHSILYNLVAQWNTDPNFSLGYLVPIFALFILWQDRKRLKAIAIQPSWAGLPIIVAALLLRVFGQLGVELFTSRFSFLLLLAGLIILFRGWPFFRAVLFPWAFLILMVPPPDIIFQKITFPLQMLASRLSTFLLEVVGVPVLREGNVIVLAAMPLEVVDACSGIRSLLSLVMLAIIYGYLLEKRIWVRVILACCAVPIAVVANAFRIFGTGLLVEYWDPDKAQGFFHEFQGWLIFVVSLIILFALHGLINLIWKPSRSVESQPIAYRDPEKTHDFRPASNWIRFLMASVLMLATAAGLQAHSQNEVFPSRQSLSALPAIDGWTSSDDELDQPTLEILGPGEFLVRDYEDPSQQQPWINLFIAYFPSQKIRESIHTPNHCLPGAGWMPTSKSIVMLTGPDGTSFPANRYVVSRGADRQLALYWFQAHGRAVASEYQAKYYLIADSIRLHRSDGALIRLMTPMLPGESADTAQARVMRLGDQLIPHLDNFIPR